MSHPKQGDAKGGQQRYQKAIASQKGQPRVTQKPCWLLCLPHPSRKRRKKSKKTRKCGCQCLAANGCLRKNEREMPNVKRLESSEHIEKMSQRVNEHQSSTSHNHSLPSCRPSSVCLLIFLALRRTLTALITTDLASTIKLDSCTRPRNTEAIASATTC